MTNSLPPDDAQRELEQRALRNVRGLVDKMDNLEQVDHKRQKRLLLTIIGIAVVMGAIVVVSVNYMSGKQQGKPVVIDPKKLPPVQGGPPR